MPLDIPKKSKLSIEQVRCKANHPMHTLTMLMPRVSERAREDEREGHASSVPAGSLPAALGDLPLLRPDTVQRLRPRQALSPAFVPNAFVSLPRA